VFASEDKFPLMIFTFT